MSRSELAQAVNAYLWEATEKRYDLDAHAIARYERGQILWPSAPYRSGLRAVLGVDSDSDLGFRPTPRGNTSQATPRPTSNETERLNEIIRKVAGEDLVGAQYPDTSSRSIVLLESLTSADLDDSSDLKSFDWSDEAAPRAITGFLFGNLHDHNSDMPFPGSRIASRIRTTIQRLTELDFEFGGGYVRKILLFFWTSEIIPALKRDYPSPVRREIFGAAAEAAGVLGWSSYDDGCHGVAQRYFIQGLRLAREANDRLMGGSILSYLSHQANYLGKFNDALHFARAAQSVLAGGVLPTALSLFLAMEARALSSVRDTRGCVAALRQAEQAFDLRKPSDGDPDWISYFDAAELAGEAAHCFRDLGQFRETLAFAKQAADLSSPSRTRAFIGMVNAVGAMDAGNIDEAISMATDSVRLAEDLQSSRYFRYLADFQGYLTSRHPTNPMVREFIDIVRETHPALLSGNCPNQNGRQG